MYGPGDRRMLKLFRAIKKRYFTMIGNGDVLFQPAYINDVVNGFVLCLRNKQAIGEAFIIGGEEYLPLKKLVDLIAMELNVRRPTLKLPLSAVLCLASICERIFVPLGIEPPLHRRRVSFFQNNRAFRIEKAKKTLGYKPEVTLQQGIHKTIQWYADERWL